MPTRQENQKAKRFWDEAVRYAAGQAERLVKKSGLTNPPIPPELLAPLQRVKRIVKGDLGNLSGLLLPLHDGFEIRINATHSPKRQNFSCAHEIAHTFFFEDAGKLLLERIKKASDDATVKRGVEELCDMAASELLMPSRMFIKYASAHHFSINAVAPLSRIFNTAINSTVLKLCEMNLKYCIAVHWTTDNSQELGQLKLKATWSTRSKKSLSSKTGKFNFKPKIFCDNSTVIEAYKSDKTTYAFQRVSVGNFRGNCRIWSKGFDSEPHRCVISFMFPEMADY